ncbi:MAG: 4-hydroxybenzoyl-CoA reductase, partial [Planctomycetota bacterium]
MLRLPRLEVLRPRSLDEALALLAEHGEEARLLAGGTDLMPNLKHRLLEPRVLIALSGIEELRGIEPAADGGFRIGATTPLAEVAAHPGLAAKAPALARAAALVASPQIRNVGTLGGNLLLDTRCQWINQSHFWRQALGFCLKKDGTKCHVVEGGSKCVAAASNDTAAALMTLDAVLELRSPGGRRELSVTELWRADGIANKKLRPDEILVALRLPPTPAGHRGAYGKLRERGSIDFPLLGLAARLDLDGAGVVSRAELAAVALQARPLLLPRAGELLAGRRSGDEDFAAAVAAVAAEAARRFRPLPNIPGDAEWRRKMVPVLARRTLLAAAAGEPE